MNTTDSVIVNVAVIVAFVMLAQQVATYCLVKMILHGRVVERQQAAPYEAPKIHRVN